VTASPPSSALRPLFIVGPTAVGKSEAALWLAEKVGGEIISVDSMQVYRGLDIGTAKPPAEERARVPHHLIDVVDLAETFDAAKFVEMAGKSAAEIQSRHRVPIFCGGTGLYFKAYLEGLGEAPPSDPVLRAELEAAPLADLLQELARRDPVAYEKMDRQNPRRVVRALEVIRLTGKTFSGQRAGWNLPRTGEPAARLLGLSRNPDDLRLRINRRVDEMFRRGLVAETENLLKHGLAENRTAMQALGYRQVVEYLRGERSLSETVELVKIRTRQFAKRQMTWFRRQLNVDWVESDDASKKLASILSKT
ncbi:MAG: tRNA (adenosine(37)-N6)-dimethylallyltransferase MiaA, partial [Akkermansiaceae bacterium]|nr:tRNA (adenosine(37)-N6)-dimethylallyltransferase MiaA [Verrucomicrobiales bacterium]